MHFPKYHKTLIFLMIELKKTQSKPLDKFNRDTATDSLFKETVRLLYERKPGNNH